MVNRAEDTDDLLPGEAHACNMTADCEGCFPLQPIEATLGDSPRIVCGNETCEAEKLEYLAEIERLNKVITRLRYSLNDLQGKVERQWPAKSDNVRESLRIAEQVLKETIADGAF